MKKKEVPVFEEEWKNYHVHLNFTLEDAMFYVHQIFPDEPLSELLDVDVENKLIHLLSPKDRSRLDTITLLEPHEESYASIRRLQ